MNRFFNLEPRTRRTIRNSINVVFDAAGLVSLVVIVAFGFAIVASFFIIDGVYK